MKQKRHSFARRLSWRIILILLVINLLTMAAVLFFVFFGMAVQSMEHYSSVITNVEEKMETHLKAVEVLAVNNVDEIEQNLDKPEKVHAALDGELRMNSAVIGCFAAFEPYYYPKYGRWYEPYAMKTDNAMIERKLIGSETHDYLQKEWYQKGLKSPNGYWSDPYYDADGANTVLCSYVLPICDESGKTVGVFGADLPLDWLVSRMKEVDMRENELMNSTVDKEDKDNLIYSFIIDRNGNFIVHTDSTKVNKNFKDMVKETSDDRDDAFCKDMLDGGNGHRIVRLEDRLVFVYYAQLIHTGWSMAIVVPMFTMFAWGIAISVVVSFLMLLGMIVVFLVSMFSVHRATQPLKYLTRLADEIANGNFQAKLPVFKRNDEISQLRNSFEAMQQSISTYIKELKETTASKASIESELRIAHDIQMAMLPKTFPPFPERNDVDVYGLLNPAKAVGGDLYDFFIRNEKLFFCIGDVSGKGVPASLVMAVTRSLFRNVAIHTSEPERIVTALNDCMSEQNDTNMFVTIFVGVLDLPTGRLRYSNAGHDAPLILDADGNNILLPCDANLPIGVMPDWKFTSQHTLVNSGSIIFLYTDGLTEAENSKHELFSMKRVINELTGISRQPQEVITKMEHAVHQFVGDAEQSDDLTMMAVSYSRLHVDTILNRELTLRNDVQEVPELTTFINEVCQELKIDTSTTMQLNLAIEEAVVNVMNYAYPAGTKGEVRIEAAANEERLRFVISDDGIPFDPTARGEVDTTLSAEDRGIGGLGIHLVRHIMDSINYERIDHHNVLTLRKNIK